MVEIRFKLPAGWLPAIMPRPYSIDLRDLRDRAVARVLAGEPVRSVAGVLEVSVASAVKWSQRFRQTGSAAPGLMHGQGPRLLLPHRDWLIARTANDQPFTLRGLQAELAERGDQTGRRCGAGRRGVRGSRFEPQSAPSGSGLVFLPPYSPDLNPIEQLFAKPKHLTQKPLNEPSMQHGRAAASS